MKKIKIEHPHLTHMDIQERWQENNIPNELIEIIKEYIPYGMSIGISHKKGTIEAEESESVGEKCSELKKKILEYDFNGDIVFNINNVPVMFRIYWDDELDHKTFDIIETKIVDFNFEWVHMNTENKEKTDEQKFTCETCGHLHTVKEKRSKWTCKYCEGESDLNW